MRTVRTPLKVLDLFSGIGGFSLGLERAGMQTVAFCEIEEYPRKVLKKHWPDVPIYEDVRTLTAERLNDDGITVDVICGGFPCQDISTAGKQAGIGEGTRSGLWSEFARLIGEIRPRYAIVENVTNLLSGPSEQRGGWFGTVLGDLAEIGYDAEWHCIPASELGANHHRDRVWVIAYTNSVDWWTKQRISVCSEWEAWDKFGWSDKENLAYSFSKRQQGQGEYVKPLFAKEIGYWKTINAEPGCISRIWAVEPELGRVANGIPNRSHRLKGLGNAVVPQIPEIIGKAIMEVECTN